MNSINYGIFITKAHWMQMEADVKARASEEACGILVGKDGHCKLVIPVTNILHNQYRFRMEPEEQLKAFILAEDYGYEILAMYHSHPNGVDKPSSTDIEELTYPGILYLIWYSVINQWNCRGYFMDPAIGTVEIPIFFDEEM